VVAIVCALFLWHVRSALVAIISLPLGLCIAFIVMHFQGLNANIMSLGGIAIAVGAMVDAAIVMIENAHKRLEEWDHQHPGEQIDNATRWKVITDASVEVGPALFISLLIITLSFIPIFTLEGQEGRLFGPLAFTKTYSMAGGRRAGHHYSDGVLDPGKFLPRPVTPEPGADQSVSSIAAAGAPLAKNPCWLRPCPFSRLSGH
jgi:Cu/Ag efflux pump CusA